jgi:transcriptional regulator with XRE-family HTH domain
MLSVTPQRICKDFPFPLARIQKSNEVCVINWEEKSKKLLNVENLKCVFSQVFTKLLNQHNLNVLEFCEKANIPRMTVYQWTWGMKCEDPHHLEKICLIFNVDYRYLYFGIGMDKNDYQKMLEDRDKQIAQMQQDKYFLEKELEAQIDMFEKLKNERAS